MDGRGDFDKILIGFDLWRVLEDTEEVILCDVLPFYTVLENRMFTLQSRERNPGFFSNILSLRSYCTSSIVSLTLDESISCRGVGL